MAYSNMVSGRLRYTLSADCIPEFPSPTHLESLAEGAQLSSLQIITCNLKQRSLFWRVLEDGFRVLFSESRLLSIKSANNIPAS